VQAILPPAEADRLLAPLLVLLGAAVEDRGWGELDPEQRRRRTLDAVRHVLLRGGHESPVCLVVEDLHWVDAESKGALDALADMLPGTRRALVVSSRPGYEHGWATKSYYSQFSLDPLPGGSATQLLDTLLGADPSLAPLKAEVIQATDGNPFFIEETVRHLAESGVVAGERGSYRLGSRPRDRAVPVTVQDVLAARIDRLELGDKEILQAAAAIGKEIPLWLLRAASGRSELELEAGLGRLQSGEFVVTSRLGPDVGYTFRHALTMEVAYGSLLRGQRRALDERIVDAIEALPESEVAVHVGRLARHSVRGQLWAPATRYCREAGARAFAMTAYRAAAGHFEDALDALRHLPETPEGSALGIDIRLELRYSLSPLGEQRRILDILREAEGLARRLGDRRRLGSVLAFLTNLLTLQGDFPSAVAHGERAWEIAGALGDVQMQAVSQSFLGLAYWSQGAYRKGVLVAGRNLALEPGRELERFGMALLPAVYSRTIVAWCLAELGDFPGAMAVGREAVAIGERAGHAHSRAFGCLGLGTALLRRGAAGPAIDVLERGVALCRVHEMPAMFIESAAPLAAAYGEHGRPDLALGLLTEAVAVAVDLRHGFGHWLKTGGLAEAHLQGGRPADALPLAQHFVKLTRAVGARGAEAWGLRLVGEAAALQATPRIEGAEAAFTECLALADELEMRPLVARCHLSRGELRLRCGMADARRDLETARDGFQALGMPAWRDRAEVALARSSTLETGRERR
jgi:tetratricopeptide (TPR) repeat protein